MKLFQWAPRIDGMTSQTFLVIESNKHNACKAFSAYAAKNDLAPPDEDFEDVTDLGFERGEVFRYVDL